MFRFIGKFIKKSLSLISLLVTILLAYIFVMTIIYPLGYREEIIEYSNRYEIDPFLVSSIINVESKYNKNAVSPKLAKGLMQIGPNTGKWGAEEIGIMDYNDDRLYDPGININIGTWYIDKLRSEFGDDRQLILAGYNAGSGNLSQWLEDKELCNDGENLNKIPFKETENYVNKVNKNYNIYKKLYGKQMYREDRFSSKYFNIIIKIRSTAKSIKESLN